MESTVINYLAMLFALQLILTADSVRQQENNNTAKSANSASMVLNRWDLAHWMEEKPVTCIIFVLWCYIKDYRCRAYFSLNH